MAVAGVVIGYEHRASRVHGRARRRLVHRKLRWLHALRNRYCREGHVGYLVRAAPRGERLSDDNSNEWFAPVRVAAVPKRCLVRGSRLSTRPAGCPAMLIDEIGMRRRGDDSPDS